MATYWLCSGGTACGAIYATALLRLWESEGPPHAMGGVSIGAVTGAGALTTEGPRKLIRIWRDVTGLLWVQHPQLDLWNGMYSLKPLERHIIEETQDATYACPVYVGVTNQTEQRYQELRIDNVSTEARARRVCASAAQPLIHQAVELDGDTYADGGVFNVLPRLDAQNIKAHDRVHAFFATPVVGRRERRVITNAFENGERALESWMDRTVKDNVDWLRTLEHRGVDVTVYHHRNPGRAFDLDPKTTAWRLGAGGDELWANRCRPSALPLG